MKLSLTFLLLQLWGCVDVSLSLTACSVLPEVRHAHVSEETKKAEYQEGDVIDFPCELGYKSDQISKYVCTRAGWQVALQGVCYSCSVLPDVPHGYVTAETRKADYQAGDMIDFSCDAGYTSGWTIKYVCSIQGWLPIRAGSCYFSASGCDPYPTNENVTVKGLPGNDGPIPPDHILTFSCDDPGKHLEGSSVLICGKDGQWNNPFPSCKENTCKAGVMHPQLYVAGLPPTNEEMKTGHKLRFLCSCDYEVDGSKEIECLQTGLWNSPFPTCSGVKCQVGAIDPGLIAPSANEIVRAGEKLQFRCRNDYDLEGDGEVECLGTGEWSGPFPTCSKKCQVPSVPPNVKFTPRVQTLSKGETLTFSCKQQGHRIQGSRTVECLENGLWSGQVPTCGDPSYCGRPPTLEDGDTMGTTREQYNRNDRVEYVCQNYYTMEGGPYKTCINGQWTGDIRCLKPCILDKEAMTQRNIRFRFSYQDKLYSAHNDEIEFMCTRGRSVGLVRMRQRCLHGVIELPTCG